MEIKKELKEYGGYEIGEYKRHYPDVPENTTKGTFEIDYDEDAFYIDGKYHLYSDLQITAYEDRLDFDVFVISKIRVITESKEEFEKEMNGRYKKHDKELKEFLKQFKSKKELLEFAKKESSFSFNSRGARIEQMEENIKQGFRMGFYNCNKCGSRLEPDVRKCPYCEYENEILL